MGKKKTTKRTVKKKTGTPGGPQKTCPKCNTTLHAAKVRCECGHKFRKKKKAAGKTATSVTAVTAGNASDVKPVLRDERKRLEKRLAAINTLLE